MSPRRRTARSRVVAAVLAVVLAAVLVGVATAYVSRGHGRGQLAAQREFSAGRVDSLAAEIAERGPFLVADASPSRQRDIYVLHTGGSEVDAGWVVVSAFAPGQTDRSCFLRWSGDGPSGAFTDPCTGSSYAAEGGDLHHYPTDVRDGRLYVDLNG